MPTCWGWSCRLRISIGSLGVKLGIKGCFAQLDIVLRDGAWGISSKDVFSVWTLNMASQIGRYWWLSNEVELLWTKVKVERSKRRDTEAGLQYLLVPWDGKTPAHGMKPGREYPVLQPPISHCASGVEQEPSGPSKSIRNGEKSKDSSS